LIIRLLYKSVCVHSRIMCIGVENISHSSGSFYWLKQQLWTYIHIVLWTTQDSFFSKLIWLVSYFLYLHIFTLHSTVCAAYLLMSEKLHWNLEFCIILSLKLSRKLFIFCQIFRHTDATSVLFLVSKSRWRKYNLCLFKIHKSGCCQLWLPLSTRMC
jgi:hypothetical protein